MKKTIKLEATDGNHTCIIDFSIEKKDPTEMPEFMKGNPEFPAKLLRDMDKDIIDGTYKDMVDELYKLLNRKYHMVDIKVVK
jgi:hypothetical protein